MKLTIVSAIVAGFFMSHAHGAFDEKGSPKKVHCSAIVLLAKNPIIPPTDLDTLLKDHTVVSLGAINPECAQYPGDTSGTCATTIEDGKIFLSYAFNTQGGNLLIEDKVTGQSTWQSWTTQYGVTKSGYLTASAWLTNVRGGLIGNERAFQIAFRCQAQKGDW